MALINPVCTVALRLDAVTTVSKAYIQILLNKTYSYIRKYLLEMERAYWVTKFPSIKCKKNLDSPDIFSLLCMCLESYCNLL